MSEAARTAFEAYYRAVGGASRDGEFERLPSGEARAWEAVAKASWDHQLSAARESLFKEFQAEDDVTRESLWQEDFGALVELVVDLAEAVPLQDALAALKGRLSVETLVRREFVTGEGSRSPRYPRFLALFVRIRDALDAGEISRPPIPSREAP